MVGGRAANRLRGRRRAVRFVTALASIVGLGCPLEANALESARLPSQHIQDAWSELHGLPQNSVRAIAETPDGLLWIGTEEGLVRFDGTGFEVFDRFGSKGRTTNVVEGLVVDGLGDLVVLGGRDGVCSFRAHDFACTRLPDGAEGLSLHVLGHDVVVATTRGVFRREAASRAAPPTFVRVEPLGLQPVKEVAASEDGRTLVALGEETGLTVVRDGTTARADLEGLAPTDLTAITRLHDGAFAIGTRRGLRRLEGGRLRSWASSPPGIVRFVHEDRDHTVWVSIFDDGLYRTRGDGWVRVPLARAQAAERLDAAFEDAAGDLWVGSRLSGLHRLRDGPIVPWGAPEGIAHGFVHAVLAHPSGDVFVAAAGGGLYVIRGDRVLHPGKLEGLVDTGVDALATGRSGTILVGTKTGAFRITSLDPLRAEALPGTAGREVTSLFEEEDELWAGTADGLLALRAGRTFDRSRALPSNAISQVVRARSGELWIGTAGGAAVLDGSGRVLPVSLGVPDGTSITAALQREDGRLFVGTSTSGLVLLDEGPRGKPTVIGRTRGLFDDTVHALVDGKDGRLWSSCNKGIYATAWKEIDAVAAGRAQSVVSRAFGRESGMRSRECNGGVPAASRGADGRIWFATMEGAVVVDPMRLREPAEPRAPILDRVRVGDEVLRGVTTVALRPDRRTMTLGFTAPALDGTTRIVEARVLGSADEAWRPIDGQSASFPTFAPGRYAIELRARDGLGRTSASSPRLVVEVPPRFVETTSFRLLTAFLASLGVLAYAWLRLRRAARAQQHLAAVVSERTAELAARNVELEERSAALQTALEDLKRAETDLVRAEKMASVATLVRGIAHELNNPLGFVTGNIAPLRRYADFLLRAIGELSAGTARAADLRLSPSKDLAFVERDLKKLLADMEEGGRRAKLIVGDLQSLTSATSRSVEPVDLAHVIRQSARLLGPAKAEGVTLTLDLEEAGSAPTVLARAGEIEQAVVVLLDNALRAVGPKGTVRVRLSREDDAHVIAVSDDGPGMSEEVRRRAAEPFFTTRAAGEGSGLGLAIATEIAAHHRGELRIESSPGAGTTVHLRVRDVT